MDSSTPSAPPAHSHAHPTTESAAASPAAEDLAHLLTYEDMDRARDRWQVARARGQGRKASFFGRFRLFWLLIGP